LSPIINQVLRRFGVIAIPTRSWTEFERRFAESEAERLRLAQEVEAACGALAGSEFPALGGDVAAAIRALRVGWEAHATALVEQLSSAHAGGAAEKALAATLSERLASAETACAVADAKAVSLDGELQACMRERELLSERLASAETASAVADAKAVSLDGELQACMRERELLSLSIGRSEARVKALARRRDRLAAECDAVRRQLAANDPSGHIRDLEVENRALALRVVDLERYLAETRGDGTRAYL